MGRSKCCCAARCSRQAGCRARSRKRYRRMRCRKAWNREGRMSDMETSPQSGRWGQQQQSWTLPPELQRSVPREVEFTAQGRIVVGLMVVAMAVAMVGSVLLFGKAQRDAQQRAQQ